METNSSSSSSSSTGNTNTSIMDPSRRYGGINILRYPLSALLEYSGILRTTPSRSSDSFLNGFRDHHHQQQQHPSNSSIDDPPSAPPASSPPTTATSGGGGEVSIRIIGAGEHDNVRPPLVSPSSADESGATTADASSGDGDTTNRGDSSYQRYDIQQVARWIEQILPFSLLLLVVFIRQHLQGFFVTIWVAAVMFKSNDILRKQTALKGERKMSVLAGIAIVFLFHVIGVYWWYRNDDLLYPLVMLPPKAIPPFWHAIFTIMVNDTMVRQAAMILKCILLMYYKNSRGRNYRKQVQSFFTALKALSHKEVHYGSYATSDQVNAAGDLCAICQEKMHAPILLRCKHIFCEDCVSEWFERERTCPLCRALVKPADLRSFGDGSTSLFFQLF
ncbi:hypothetical protein IFM89_005326 [Coptis chinensis]|uniref:RING-type domain-containing protein n=1 Tax=Coptis chinensis TaxID=261450 RepID=A0A835LIB1_9MAGN|nr:hypothetical protein IFM89_005326 [Coptis chinensis]